MKKEKLAAPNIISLKAVAEKKAMGVKIQVQKAARADVVTVYRKNGTAVTKIGAVNAAGIVYDQNPVSNKTLSYYAVAEASSGKYLASNPGPAKSIKRFSEEDHGEKDREEAAGTHFLEESKESKAIYYLPFQEKRQRLCKN